MIQPTKGIFYVDDLQLKNKLNILDPGFQCYLAGVNYLMCIYHVLVPLSRLSQFHFLL